MVFPYMTHLLAAMLLGALIGAERQWRQRMAGLRTNALVAVSYTHLDVYKRQGRHAVSGKRPGAVDLGACC